MDPEEILIDLGFKPKTGPSKPRQTALKEDCKPEIGLPSLSEEEHKLLKIIGFQPSHIDKITTMSHLATPQVIGLLQGLVLEGWLEELPGKRFGLHPARRELLAKT